MPSPITLFLQKNLLRSAFVKNVITLMTGTGLAQIVPILAAPLLTRLFTPADYGIMTLYTSVVGIVSLVATGMYVHAIILGRNNAEASNALGLSLLLTTIVSLVTLAVVAPLGGQIARWLIEASIEPWLYLVPLSVFLTGAAQSLNYWWNRQQQYRLLASSRVMSSVSGTGTQVGLGYASTGGAGLIAGTFIGQIVALLMMVVPLWPARQLFRQELSWSGVKGQARQHKNLPLYLLPAEFINVLINRTPIFFLTIFATADAVGFYGFALRILGLPTSLLAASVSDVFRERANSDYVEHGNCLAIYVKTLKSLTLLAIGPFVLLFVAAPALFAFVFGEQWRPAGEYTRWLSIMYFAGFVSSPLSYVYYIAGKQREDLFLHVYMTVSTSIVMYVGHRLFVETVYVVLLFSLNYTIIYLIYLLRSYTFAKGS